MTLHGLPAPLTSGRLVAERVGHGIHFVLQRLQHARAVLELYLALQQHELRDFLQGRTLRSLHRFCRRTGLSLLGQEPPAFCGPRSDHRASPRRTVS